jgi:hypothetical protein
VSDERDIVVKMVKLRGPRSSVWGWGYFQLTYPNLGTGHGIKKNKLTKSWLFFIFSNFVLFSN